MSRPYNAHHPLPASFTLTLSQRERGQAPPPPAARASSCTTPSRVRRGGFQTRLYSFPPPHPVPHRPRRARLCHSERAKNPPPHAAHGSTSSPRAATHAPHPAFPLPLGEGQGEGDPPRCTSSDQLPKSGHPLPIQHPLSPWERVRVREDVPALCHSEPREESTPSPHMVRPAHHERPPPPIQHSLSPWERARERETPHAAQAPTSSPRAANHAPHPASPLPLGEGQGEGRRAPLVILSPAKNPPPTLHKLRPAPHERLPRAPPRIPSPPGRGPG